jgi:hypothetical protein
VFGAPPSAVTVEIVRRRPGWRATRAGLTLAACWLLAAVAVLIPVAHFVLVPALLVAGAVLAVRRLREQASIVRVRGACPRCRREQEFRPGGPFRWERSFECPGCLNTLRLVPAAAAAA